MKERRDEASTKIMVDNQKQLAEVYAQQETFWRQRPKTLWLREGDQNTKFFHAAVKNRRAINKINTLQNKDSQMVGWGTGLEITMIGYFTNLFTASNTDWGALVECVQEKLTREQNDSMLADIVTDDVKNTLFHMQPDKSPGPDGMNPGFYQKFWHIVGKDIVDIIKRLFTTGQIDTQLHSTYIVLIPKKKNAKLMNDLRPISLFNAVYKIISKVLTNKLK